MQVTINIDTPEGLSLTIEEVFGAMTEEAKAKLAENLGREFILTEPSAERASLREAALAEIMRDGITEYRRTERFETREDALKNPSVVKRLKTAEEQDTTRSLLFKKLSEDILNHYNKRVSKFVESDELVKKLLENTVKEMKSRLPDIIQTALVQHFCGELAHISSKIMGVAAQIPPVRLCCSCGVSIPTDGGACQSCGYQNS